LDIVDRLIALGHEVDPVIEKYLEKDVHLDFVPVATYQVGAGGKRVRSALTSLVARPLEQTDQERYFPPL